jgi:hypothetical protein
LFRFSFSSSLQAIPTTEDNEDQKYQYEAREADVSENGEERELAKRRSSAVNLNFGSPGVVHLKYTE